MTKMQDKEIAKTIILQIVRQAGGVLDNKTNLYKAFYYAHLHFADRRGYYLSTWPIVRMPNGPGIDSFDVLLGELMAEGKMECISVEWRDCSGFRFSIPSGIPQETLPIGAEEAIAYALKQIKGKTASAVSAQSHDDSRSWREASDGEELNIYTDLLGDEEYRQRKQRAAEIAEAMKAVW
jgi:hypothetical protein